VSKIRKVELKPLDNDNESKLEPLHTDSQALIDDTVQFDNLLAADTKLQIKLDDYQSDLSSQVVDETLYHDPPPVVDETRYHDTDLSDKETAIFTAAYDPILNQEKLSKEFFDERYKLTGHTAVRKKNILRTGLSNGNFDLDSQIKTGARVYRLKGFTTVARITRKFHQENRQRKLRNLLTVLVIIIFVVVMLIIYNPIKDIPEWRKILGVDSLYGGEQTNTTMASNSSEAPDTSSFPIDSDLND
jgi:hypothetical protein